MSRPTEYSALAYQTYTGKVFAELPLTKTPTWSSGINEEGSGTLNVSIGHTSNNQRVDMDTARTVAQSGFASVAVIHGDRVCLAGPVGDGVEVDEAATELKLPFKGIWEELNHRLLTHPDWNHLTQSILSEFADVSYVDSLPNIAKQIIRDALIKPNRVGASLPITVDPNGAAGTNERNYFGYEFKMVGSALRDLTQVENGPDIFFRGRYNDLEQYVTHRAMIGEPYIVQGGDPVQLDYGSNLWSVKEVRSAKNLAVNYFVKGSGDKRAANFAWNGFNTLISRGYPLRDHVDTSHSSAEQQETLNGYAESNQTTYGNGSILTWTAKAHVGILELALPGWRVRLNMQRHGWIPDGMYESRILDIAQASGEDDGTVTLALEVRPGGY